MFNWSCNTNVTKNKCIILFNIEGVQPKKIVLILQINKLQIQWQITSQYLGKLQIVGKSLSIIEELPIVGKHSMVKKIKILENV